MIKEAIAVLGAIGASSFLAPKIANKLIRPELEQTDATINKSIVLGTQFGVGLLAYFGLRKIGL